MSDDEPLNQVEVDDAIQRVGHQLDLLRSGPTLGGAFDDGAVIAELEAELAALKQMKGQNR